VSGPALTELRQRQRDTVHMTILRDLLPDPDALRTEVRVVQAPIHIVYDSVLTTDMLDAVRRNPIVRALFAVRSWAERVAAAVRHRPFEEPPTPATLRLADLEWRGEWVVLGVQRPVEFAFGVIGRFWAGETRWLTIDGGAFTSFSQPGYAKIGCNMWLRPLDDGCTLLFYEARTRATDDASRREFLRYWRFVAPFVGYIMRATLAVIARNAESRAARLLARAEPAVAAGAPRPAR
jgi:hypothetical protein